MCTRRYDTGTRLGVRSRSRLRHARGVRPQGIDFDEKGLVLISDNIRKSLGIDVSVLMGANIAKEVR